MNSVQQFADRAREQLSERYFGLTELAQGTSGIVFSGYVGGPKGPQVAVKVAYPTEDAADPPHSVVRFRRESEIGASLQHPRILRTSAVQELDGIEYYEMDMAGPYRLDHVALSNKPPGFDRIISIMTELAEALDFAHAHGIVHGGLRPSAVFLDASGHVVLKGFLLYEDTLPTNPALAPATVGNAAYMSPEQWRQPTIDRRADVYAAGVLAYELCTGERRVSYEIPGVPEIRPIELPPGRSLRDGIPVHVNAAIRHATSKDAAVRFASVGRFVDALARPDVALGHSQPMLLPAGKKEKGSHWMLVALVCGVAAATLLAFPSVERDSLVRWAKAHVSWNSKGFDPFGRADATNEGGAQARPSRGKGTTTRNGSDTAKRTARDSAPAVLDAPKRANSGREGTRNQRVQIGQPLTTRTDPSGTNVDARTNATDKQAPGQEKATSTGILKVTVDKGRALVVVNGIPRGFAPVIMSVKPGDYRVTLRGSLSYDPREMKLVVSARDTAFAEFYTTSTAPPDSGAVSVSGAGGARLPR